MSVTTAAHAKPFMDYLKPMPPVAPLSDATWGDPGVIPRDISNGIESTKGKAAHPEWYYWDGQIIRAKDGKYHMFMSTFDANSNFGTAWMGSDAYHAISETNVLGPYVRKDYVYSTGGSTPHKGHNVSAVELPDGTYVVIVSEVVPFQLFKSTSLDGPWTGCSPQSDIGSSNISMFPRHDGKFQITERNGRIAISDTLCGHYVKQTPKLAYTPNPTDAQGNPVSGTIYAKRTSIPGVSNPSYLWQEDPHIWRSGGTYHVVYSGSGDRVGWHVYSPDGLSWKDNGYAWSPRDYQKIFCYEGSTHCDAWYKMERPGVVLQDGHPTHMTWAVADVDKDNKVTPGTNHGTKVVVIPFDGEQFDKDFGDGSTGGTGGSTGTGGTTGAGGSTAAGGSKGGSSAAGGTTSGGGTTSSGAAGTTGSKPTAGTTSTSASSSGGNTGTTGTGTGGKAGSTASGGAGAGGSVSSSPMGGSSSLANSSPSGGSNTPSGGSSASGGASSKGGDKASSGEPASSGGKGGGSSGSISTASGGGGGCSIAFGAHDATLPGLLLGALGMLLIRRRNRGRR